MSTPHLVEGQFFQPLSSKSRAARLRVEPCEEGLFVTAILEDGDETAPLAVDDLQAEGCLHFAGGCYFKADRPLPQEIASLFKSRTQRRIARLEAFSLPKALALGLALILCVLAFRAAIPLAASGIAAALPDRLERMIGEQAYASMKVTGFADSGIPPERQQELRRRAAALAETARLTRRPEIFFHRSALFGANALALPGGPIVVTDELVALLGSDDAVLAVIAHEMAHVERRHALQQVLNVAGAAAMASVVLGVDDSMIEELSATLINVWSFKNSRDYEKEADLIGLDILRAAKLDPRLFLTAIEKLTLQGCADLAGDALARCRDKSVAVETGWMSTHPAAKDRLGYLRAAIGG